MKQTVFNIVKEIHVCKHNHTCTCFIVFYVRDLHVHVHISLIDYKLILAY